MENMNDIVKLAIDLYNGSVEKYSTSEAQETLRNALIAANNGKTTLDYRAIRDGRCSGLFTIIEDIIGETVEEGLKGDEYFNMLVDYRNVGIGDKNEFVIEDGTLFAVADTAEGTQGVRRQRLGGSKRFSIPTVTKTVRIYEELNRVLSGRVDFNELIKKVSESLRQQLLNDIYSVWTSATAAELGGATYCVAGGYNEQTLLNLIAHVEAAAGGKPATIIATKVGARQLVPTVASENAKDDLYKLGYYGSFYGTPIVVTPNRHKIGATQFVLDDNIITIVAGDQKPIKVVREGDPIVILGDPLTNADLTQEYFVADRWGVGLVLNTNHGIGTYEL